MKWEGGWLRQNQEEMMAKLGKKSKTLGFKPRFVEEVLAFTVRLPIVLLPQNTFYSLLLWHVHDTPALSFITSILFSSNLISTTIGSFFPPPPPFLMLSSNELRIFFCFSPCSVKLSQQKFPVHSITIVPVAMNVLFSIPKDLDQGKLIL